jgi:Protein of unknown function (DUF3592)
MESRLGWGRLLLGLGLCALSVLLMVLTFRRNDRLLRTGDRIPATVVAAYPEGANRYPPYGMWGPRLEVSYELGGRTRTSTLWLDSTKDTDYVPGQEVELFVSRRFPRRVRTASDRNLYGGVTLNVELFLGFVGLFFAGWGLVGMIFS